MCKIISFPVSCIVRVLRALDVLKLRIFSMNSNVSSELVGVSLLNWVKIHGDNYHN